MKTFKLTSSHLLLCVFLNLLWGAPDTLSATTTTGTEMTSPVSSTITPTTTTLTTLEPTTKLAPANPEGFQSTGQNETSITLQWKKVDDILNYTLIFDVGVEDITASVGDDLVNHTVLELTSGTKYNFTLFSVFESIRSSGVNLTAATAPANPEDFRSTGQNETSITLQWKKVDDILNYALKLNGHEENITASVGDDLVNHTVLGLTSGTKYDFTLFSVFESIGSSGVNLNAATVPANPEDFRSTGQNETSITLQWKKVDDILNYTLKLNGHEEDITASVGDDLVNHTVLGLTSGTKYNFTLFSVFESIRSSGVNLVNAATAPANPEEFGSIGQNETSITLQWNKVDDILNYTLKLNGHEEDITASVGDDLVNHTVLGLTSGTKYNFTLFSVFESIRSSGVNLNAATVPSQVASVSVTVCSVNMITLMWQISVTKGWMYFLHINGIDSEVYPKEPGNNVSHSVQHLQPGEVYPFSLITGFSGLNSTAYTGTAVTAVDCTGVSWHVTNSAIQGMVAGLFTNATITNGSYTLISPGDNNVSFTGLYPGATYEISFEYEHSTCTPRCSLFQITLPPDVVNVGCKYRANGYSVHIVWDEPEGVLTEVEVNVAGQTHRTSESEIIIPGFQPARTYEVSLVSLSGYKRSQTPVALLCKTDPRVVIAGSVFGVLLFVLLIILIIFIVLKRPQIMRKRHFSGNSKRFGTKSKPISLAQFPQHFYQLSADDNRGFSEQYETLMSVGTEQTQTEALLPGNKTKNRFINVLPYDRSRVKLSIPNPHVPCDYINANYMPGHNNNREYIATQGPLPNTVNDFWRMIWEHRVKGVVMLANCIEAGRTKCEQYWPSGNKPSTYGDLEVTLASEQRYTNWTLREFIVKHGNTSEERTVKHFHFTAWPDHGIPQGTEVLIQFRRLMRQHMEREANGAPTVVHCSAGVGRTGTIIALDVLLQQLEEEGTVNVSDFVHKMRLNRPHMVQTESQYVFLHQCIMDYLQLNENPDENIYENEDLMYVNATALREMYSNA